MQIQSAHDHVEIPERMRTKLEAFRRRVWIIKLAEGVLAALFGWLLSYVLVFALDRVWDTPTWLRAILLLGGTAGIAVVLPLKWYRWVWRTRGLEQVARLLRYTFPRFGDRLLGIVELAQNELEQERSVELCRAAMRQVDEDTRQPDFRLAVPHPRHRQWAWAAGSLFVLSAAALTLVPAAGTNALLRWLLPWRATERYTFAQLDSLPDEIVVPSAEPFQVQARLAESTVWSPRRATARYGRQLRIEAALDDRGYAFEVPPQKQAQTLVVAAGDARRQVAIRPTPRPELTSLVANITLPEYLEYREKITRDVRSGVVSVVRGSHVRLAAETTRDLERVLWDGAPLVVNGDRFVTPPTLVSESSDCELTWRDVHGLSAEQPFRMSIHAVEDNAPSIYCTKLSAEQVVLNTDVLSFQVVAEDDFGVQRVGLEWAGVEHPVFNPHPASGEKLVAAGDPQQQTLDATATFCAEYEGVAPQLLQIRLFAVDYLPGRPRVYSPKYVLHVLSPEDHAIWITAQLRKWFRQAQGVQEREQQLHETNRQLRALPADQLDLPETRRRIELQAAAEQANGRRLNAVTDAGERLIKEALRNDQFNVATLENWADMLQSLRDIANQRMPSVADLLRAAQQAPAGQPAQAKPSAPTSAAPQVGQNRDPRAGTADQPQQPNKSPSKPAITDVESGFNELNSGKSPPTPPSSPRFTLPSTSLLGGGEAREGADACPAGQEMEAAVQAQEDLLAEFAKVMDELQKILGNLEGSTFVKRLKAASRRQIEVARDVNQSMHPGFGLQKHELEPTDRDRFRQVAMREIAHSDNVYLIQEDLEAYFNRMQQGKFKTVLSDMKQTRVVSQLRKIAGLAEQNMSGQTVARAEFWADTLDRWAEQLVGPG